MVITGNDLKDYWIQKKRAEDELKKQEIIELSNIPSPTSRLVNPALPPASGNFPKL